MKKVILTKKQLAVYFKNFQKADVHFSNRIKYIIDKIGEVFNAEVEYVYDHIIDLYINFINGQAEDSFYYYDHFCRFNLNKNKDYKCINIVYDGDMLYLLDGFPIEWITKDFEQDLIKGKKLYEELMVQENKFSKEKKIKNKNLIKSALKKLTNEEKQALNIK